MFKPAEVLETTVTRQGGRDIIVERIALDPDDPIRPVFPASPTVLPATPPGDDDAADFSDTAPFQLRMLSATVFPGPRTFLNWSHRFEDGVSRHFSGWSNIDFNHYTGVSTILGTDGKHHTYVMGIGTEQAPAADAPEFDTDEPTFIPDGEIPAEALVLVDSLHRIYATEAGKLAAAHAGREAVRLAKEAELIANPPQPKDLIIRYRIAITPQPAPTEGGAQ